MKRSLLNRLSRLVITLLSLAGVVLIATVCLAFTPYPYRMYRTLALAEAGFEGEPDYIIMLGGGGVPSESGLVRAWHTVKWARHHPAAQIIIALPYDEPYLDSSASMMVEEFKLRGIPGERLTLEPRGRNTREQALNVARLVRPDPATARCMLVTSPDHMKRAVLSFRKAGFGKLISASAFAESINANLAYTASELHDAPPGAKPPPILPDPGGSMMARYGFWNNLSYMNGFARESVALLYYRLQGWL